MWKKLNEKEKKKTRIKKIETKKARKRLIKTKQKKNEWSENKLLIK